MSVTANKAVETVMLTALMRARRAMREALASPASLNLSPDDRVLFVSENAVTVHTREEALQIATAVDRGREQAGVGVKPGMRAAAEALFRDPRLPDHVHTMLYLPGLNLAVTFDYEPAGFERQAEAAERAGAAQMPFVAANVQPEEKKLVDEPLEPRTDATIAQLCSTVTRCASAAISQLNAMMHAEGRPDDSIVVIAYPTGTRPWEVSAMDRQELLGLARKIDDHFGTNFSVASTEHFLGTVRPEDMMRIVVFVPHQRVFVKGLMTIGTWENGRPPTVTVVPDARYNGQGKPPSKMN